MAIFHGYVSHNQRVHHIRSHSTTILDPIKSHHISPNVFHIYMGISSFWMGKSTISTVIFHIHIYIYNHWNTKYWLCHFTSLNWALSARSQLETYWFRADRSHLPASRETQRARALCPMAITVLERTTRGGLLCSTNGSSKWTNGHGLL